MKFIIPKHWKWVTLGDIGIVVSGGTPSTKEPEFWNGDIQWVTPADLSNHNEVYISKGSRSISQIGLEYSSACLLPVNSIIFSSRAPIGYVAISKNKLATNQGFKNLILPTDFINPKYVYYYLKTVKELAENMASGTTFLELSASKFKQIPFPLAPLEEQNFIIDKIEELFSTLDNCLFQLEELLSKSENLKQKILDDIFIKKNCKYNPLDQLVDSIDYGYTSKSFKSKKTNSIHYLRITDIQNRKIDWAKVPFCEVTDEKITKKYLLKNDDILFARSGNTVGKSILIINAPKSVYASYLIRIRCNKNLINPRFLSFFMLTSYYWKQINDGITGIGQPNFNGKKLGTIQVPAFEIKNQEKIISYVENSLFEIEKLIQEVKNSINRTKIFKSQILRNAYYGKLINENSEQNIEILFKNVQHQKEKIQQEIFKLSKKRNKIHKTEINLYDIIKNSFGKDSFYYSDVFQLIKLSKGKLKIMFNELEKAKLVIGYFDENSGTLKYKLV